MAEKTQSYRVYATKHPYHIIPFLLGVILCAISLFLGSGIVELILLVLAEFIFQLFAPNIQFFRDGLDSEVRIAKEEEQHRAQQREIDALGSIAGIAYTNLLWVQHEIKTHIANQPVEVRLALIDVGPRATKLVRTYYRLTLHKKNLQEFLTRPDNSNLDLTLRKLKGTITEAKSEAVRQMDLKRVALLEARLERVHSAEDQIPIIDAQLETIKESLLLIRDQVLAPAGIMRVRVDVDEILRSVGENTGLEDITSALADVEETELEVKAYKEALEEQ